MFTQCMDYIYFLIADLLTNQRCIQSHDPNRNARIMRWSDPTSHLVKKKKESDESTETITGTKLAKKVREEMGELTKAFS
jgi:hypothetical protein